MKIVINKLVGDLGEQWSIEVPVGNELLKSPEPVAAIKANLGSVLRVVDDRLLELNMRLLDSNRMAQTLTPEAMLALRQTVEVMYGSRVAPDGPVRPQVNDPSAQAKVPTEDAVAGKLEKALEAVDVGRS